MQPQNESAEQNLQSNSQSISISASLEPGKKCHSHIRVQSVVLGATLAEIFFGSLACLGWGQGAREVIT